MEKDGWIYTHDPDGIGDNRKLISAENQGMEWVGIAVWNEAQRGWFQNNSPLIGQVKAWRELPEIAKGYWDRGILTFAQPPKEQQS